MNFDYKGKDLWVADPAGGYIDKIDPADGSIEYQYNTGTTDPPFGIAPEPG
jgi:DNA-binding beta-propeller fold protein YncE